MFLLKMIAAGKLYVHRFCNLKKKVLQLQCTVHTDDRVSSDDMI
jgi:hypothetical protein